MVTVYAQLGVAVIVASTLHLIQCPWPQTVQATLALDLVLHVLIIISGILEG